MSWLFVGFTIGLLVDFLLTKGIIVLYKRRVSFLQKQVEDWRQLSNDWKNLSRKSQADFIDMNQRWKEALEYQNTAWKKLIRETFGVEANEPLSEKEKLQ